MFGHGTEGTRLEAFTQFGLVHLRLQGLVQLNGENFWQWTGQSFKGIVDRKSIDKAIWDLKQLRFAGITDTETAIIMLLDKYSEATLLAAAKKLSETR